MISFSLYNSKGGVGKTSTCVNLSFLSASEGRKTLLWDLDPQASSTYYCRSEPKLKGGIKKLARGRKRIDSYIKSTPYENLSLLPSAFSARNLDIIFHSTKKPKKQLKLLIEKIVPGYDILFLDAPPGFSLLSENILRAVDRILFPMIPTTLSVRTFLQITKYLEDLDLETNIVLPFFSLVDLRKKMHRETVQAYTEGSNNFLKAYIPYSSDVEKMGVHCAPLFIYSHQSKAAEAYRSLWQEIKDKTLS